VSRPSELLGNGSLAELAPTLVAPPISSPMPTLMSVASPDFTVPGAEPDSVARTLLPNENKGGRLVLPSWRCLSPSQR
jgi:hypothetical protein